MSLPQLLSGVVTQLITYGNANPLTGDSTAWVQNRTVSAEESETPPPEATGFPDFYATVHAGSWNSGELQDTNPGLHEVFGFNVTVAKKIGTRPKTKFYDAAYVDNQCLYNRVRQVIKALNWNTDLLVTANALLSGNKFVTPPVWKKCESPFRVVGGEWLANPTDKIIVNNLYLICTIEFMNVERIQCSTDPVT